MGGPAGPLDSTALSFDPQGRTFAGRVALLLCLFAALPAAGQDPAATFDSLATRLAAERLDGVDTPEAVQEQALAILDAAALEGLQAAEAPDLEALVSRLSRLVPRTRVGENYRFALLGGDRQVLALTVNFGFAGPAAVRLYARQGGRWQRAARIDRFTHPDFFDEALELLPLETAEPVFVTVTGRSDELATGWFAAWRLAGSRLERLWSAELLLRSSYEARPDGLVLTYCADSDPARPRDCPRMTRERYAWGEGAWRRVEQADAPQPSEPSFRPPR